jgi:hypothetical protein
MELRSDLLKRVSYKMKISEDVLRGYLEGINLWDSTIVIGAKIAKAMGYTHMITREQRNIWTDGSSSSSFYSWKLDVVLSNGNLMGNRIDKHTWTFISKHHRYLDGKHDKTTSIPPPEETCIKYHQVVNIGKILYRIIKKNGLKERI